MCRCLIRRSATTSAGPGRPSTLLPPTTRACPKDRRLRATWPSSLPRIAPRRPTSSTTRPRSVSETFSCASRNRTACVRRGAAGCPRKTTPRARRAATITILDKIAQATDAFGTIFTAIALQPVSLSRLRVLRQNLRRTSQRRCHLLRHRCHRFLCPLRSSTHHPLPRSQSHGVQL